AVAGGSRGPGLERVLAQFRGDALGPPAARFDVRHADTASVESGVGTYGSRGTVTAGNAAHLAAQKLIEEARRRAATRLAVPESEITYAQGALSAGGPRPGARAGAARRAPAPRGRPDVEKDDAARTRA